MPLFAPASIHMYLQSVGSMCMLIMRKQQHRNKLKREDIESIRHAMRGRQTHKMQKCKKQSREEERGQRKERAEEERGQRMETERREAAHHSAFESGLVRNSWNLRLIKLSIMIFVSLNASLNENIVPGTPINGTEDVALV